MFGGQRDRDGDGVTDREEEERGLDADDPDSDDDGLSDGDELELGADPLAPDSDGDGLLDGEEAEIGSDPTQPDSDFDGYLDPWEVAEGSDPTDACSRIYEGSWPYNPDKAGVDNPHDFPSLPFVDQHGDDVDPLDFGGHGKYLVVNLVATWEGSCHAQAAWLAGEENEYYDDLGPDVVAALENGDAYVLTILVETRAGALPSADDVESWAEDYKGAHLPVLADLEQVLHVNPAFAPEWYSYAFLLDDQFHKVTEDGYFESAIAALQDRL